MKFLAKWRLRKPADDTETVYVSEKYGVRSLHIGSDTVQSAMRIAKPNDLELSYTRSMMAFLLFSDRPTRILMVGLGGGSLAKFVYHRLPWVTTEVVEVNPRVVAIARELGMQDRAHECGGGHGRTKRPAQHAELIGPRAVRLVRERPRAAREREQARKVSRVHQIGALHLR